MIDSRSIIASAPLKLVFRENSQGLAGPSFRTSLKTQEREISLGVSPDLTRGYWSSASPRGLVDPDRDVPGPFCSINATSSTVRIRNFSRLHRRVFRFLSQPCSLLAGDRRKAL